MAKPLFRTLLDASTVGINLVVSTFVGLAIGYFLDGLFGTSPWLTIIFLVIGIAAGFYELYRFAREKMENTGEGPHRPEPPIPPRPGAGGEPKDKRVRHYSFEELKDIDLGEGEEELIERGDTDADDKKNL